MQVLAIEMTQIPNSDEMSNSQTDSKITHLSTLSPTSFVLLARCHPSLGSFRILETSDGFVTSCDTLHA